MKSARRLGLTGGIGSGKSTVSALFAESGAAIVDADAISRQLTATGGLAIPAIAHAFGAAAIAADGALHRAFMRQLVFQDPAARQRLEAIIHPLVAQQTQQRISQAEADGCALIVFDVPLLVESGRWRQQVDAVLVIDCEEATQIQRVMARSQLDPASIEKIMAAQATRAQRRAAADWVIYNDGLNLAQLRQEVLSISAQLQL